MTALRRIDPSVENVPMASFDEFGPMFEGMSEVWAELPNSKPSAAEAEIARLMETGLDRNAAINIADGVWVTSQPHKDLPTPLGSLSQRAIPPSGSAGQFVAP